MWYVLILLQETYPLNKMTDSFLENSCNKQVCNIPSQYWQYVTEGSLVECGCDLCGLILHDSETIRHYNKQK